MGEVLKNTAQSVNVKERMDFSCALFNHNGDLIANAPHIPIHLGAMSDTVKYLIDKHKLKLLKGETLLHNDPYSGGTHLPDLTVITPFLNKKKIKFFFYLQIEHTILILEVLHLVLCQLFLNQYMKKEFYLMDLLYYKKKRY